MPNKSKLGKGTMEIAKEKTTKQPVEKWKRQDDRDLREKRCFICGREGHIKKECPQHRAASGMKSICHLMLIFWCCQVTAENQGFFEARDIQR